MIPRPSPYGQPPLSANASTTVPAAAAAAGGAAAGDKPVQPAYVGVGGFPLPPLPSDFVYGVTPPVNLNAPEGTKVVKGYDFSEGNDVQKVVDHLITCGFQATNLALAMNEINRMRKWRLSDEPIAENEDPELKDMERRRQIKCKIFLAFTSNMISCGVRETLKFLAKERAVDVMVTTAGGIEEDFMKCLAPVHLGAFDLAPAVELRMRGLNRTGNLITENRNYCLFEEWLMPILDAMLEEQQRDGIVWTPSRMIHRMGKEINHPDSVYYWCYKNNIPVFCPALTDGSIGDILYFHSFAKPGLILDLIQDMRLINHESIHSHKLGALILGGGTSKHHVMNACLMKNGADFAVIVSTAQEFDGSDSGAAPSEAISWGKIKYNAKPVKVHGDASILFPLIVSQTFAKKD